MAANIHIPKKLFLFKKPLPSIQVTPSRAIGDEQPCFIVAEIGQNHNGDITIARELVDKAASLGADAVKFCKRHIPSELTREAYNKPYVGPQSFGDTYGQHREFLELTREAYGVLREHAVARGLVFFASACDQHSVDDLEEVGVPLYKIASRDLTNLPLIDYIARTGKPVILSCGMDSMVEIGEAVDAVRKHHNRLVLLQCTSGYPTEYDDVNIRVMHTLRHEFDVLTGMSDHTIGFTVAVVSAALGAVVVEKHITLARYMKGTDHACSLEPDGLRRLVRDIRNTEKAMGDGLKAVTPAVAATRDRLCRSLVSRCQIAKGATLSEDMVCMKSPGTGLRWRDRGRIVGKRASRDIPADVTLSSHDFE